MKPLLYSENRGFMATLEEDCHDTYNLSIVKVMPTGDVEYIEFGSVTLVENGNVLSVAFNATYVADLNADSHEFISILSEANRELLKGLIAPLYH